METTQTTSVSIFEETTYWPKEKFTRRHKTMHKFTRAKFSGYDAPVFPTETDAMECLSQNSPNPVEDYFILGVR